MFFYCIVHYIYILIKLHLYRIMAPTKGEITRCGIADAEVLEDLERQGFCLEDNATTGIEHQLVDRAAFDVFVYRRSSRIEGFAVMKKGDRIKLTTLIVGERYRRGGVGTELLLFCKDYARQQGGTSIGLTLDRHWHLYPFLKEFYRAVGGFELESETQKHDTLVAQL